MTNLALDLFSAVPSVPITEGIKYAGSKKKLLPQILYLISKVGAESVLDGFAGSTRVSQALAKRGRRVICNDTSVWSEVFARCYLKSRAAESYQELVDHLNHVAPEDGWFTEHYGGSPGNSDTKMPWQVHNTRKLDGVRNEIDRLALRSDEKAVALTSLVLGLDRVDNTMGHYCSYLKDWSARSYGQLQLRMPKIVESDKPHEVFRSDIFDVAGRTNADLAYFDPPYGSNNEKMPPSRVRYAAYYHVWTTVCLNDKPNLFGKANRRADSRDMAAPSVFEEFRKNDAGQFIAVEAVERLIRETSSRFIILSYSSGGRATATELQDAINGSARILDVIEVDYKQNVMSGMSWTNEWLREAKEPHREFLFLMEKRG